MALISHLPAGLIGRPSPPVLAPKTVGETLQSSVRTTMTTTVTVRSFAKINLGLYIGAPREDGFHELLTVYQTIGLYDVIRVSVARGNRIEIRCHDPRVPRDESNTCYRIAEKAMVALGVDGRVVIEIEKRLPVQGGLGGASANAVAALLALERALKKNLPEAEKLRIAAEVGSDLPLFLIGGTVLGLGRGEQVYPLPDLPATACVIVTPDVGVSTPKAFAEWDRLQVLKPGSAWTHSTPPRSSGSLRAGFEGGRPYMSQSKLTTSAGSGRIKELGRRLSARLSALYSGAPLKLKRGRAENPLLALVRAGIENDGIENDFERVVFPEYPKLNEGKRALLRAGAKYASLSGSGSALYGLFASKAAAETASAKLREQGWAAQATATLTRRQYWSRVIG